MKIIKPNLFCNSLRVILSHTHRTVAINHKPTNTLFLSSVTNGEINERNMGNFMKF